MLPEAVALGIFWVSLSVSLAFSVFAAVDSWREYADVRATHMRVGGVFANGRVDIARFRKTAGLKYVVGFNAMAVVFALAAYRAFAIAAEPRDTLVLAAATRLFAVTVVLAFWGAMRDQRKIRAELARQEEGAEIKGVRRLQEETHKKVDKIDQKLDGKEAPDG